MFKMLRKNIQDKILDITTLASETDASAVGNKIPSVSNLVKKTDYNIKVTEIENEIIDRYFDKYITYPEFNRIAKLIWQANKLI